MRSAFSAGNSEKPVRIEITTQLGSRIQYELTNDNKPYSSWFNHMNVMGEGSREFFDEFADFLKRYMDSLGSEEERSEFAKQVSSQISSSLASVTRDGVATEATSSPIRIELHLEGTEPFKFNPQVNPIDQFVVYSPENTALRVFEREGQIEPLGINGEGLLKLLLVMSKDQDREPFERVKKALRLLNWFEDFSIVDDGSRSHMQIEDAFLDRAITGVDQRSVNEGFLFVAFYFALFASKLTPQFFAIDNIDASLNPRLCQAMTGGLVQLARETGKQVILTTHNPAVLDGLNLRDPEQRLFIVSRDRKGKTKVRRFVKDLPAELPSRMSELFLRGAIGGLPKSF
jgi:hypothetical protein